MSNSIELVSTGQVVVTEVTEQVIEVQTPAAPVTVEVVTAGPQGPAGVSAFLGGMEDVDTTQRVDKSVLYFDEDTGMWRGDDINTVITLVDGGNW
jgi:hypothetical protein